MSVLYSISYGIVLFFVGLSLWYYRKAKAKYEEADKHLKKAKGLCMAAQAMYDDALDDESEEKMSKGAKREPVEVPHIDEIILLRAFYDPERTYEFHVPDADVAVARFKKVEHDYNEALDEVSVCPLEECMKACSDRLHHFNVEKVLARMDDEDRWFRDRGFNRMAKGK